MSCSFDAEKSFGPVVSSCRRSFDFTLLFEEVSFQILPSALFLLFVGFRLLFLVRAPASVHIGALSILKLFSATAFSILDLVTLIFVCLKHDGITPTSIPAAALSLVAAFSVIIISHYDHTRSYSPSLLLGIYLCITALLKSATVRTYWSLDGDRTIATTTLSALTVQLIMLVLESCSKRRYITDGELGVSNEGMAGFLSRSLFAWLNRLLLTGYRRSLVALDLQPIDTVLRTPYLKKRFDGILQGRPFGSTGLPGRTLRGLGFYLFAPILPRLCLTAFTFSQPFLTSSLISYLGDGNTVLKDYGYGLVGATFLTYVGIALSNAWYWHMCYKSTTMMRGGLVDAIFEKLLRLSQDKDSESKALTLMISDVQRITATLAYMHELWAGPMEAGLATWLLWRQVGASSLTVLGLALTFTIISLFIGKSSAFQQRRWLEATETRIAATKKMLSSLKTIKMTGADNRASFTLEALRTKEFAASKMFRTLMIGSVLSCKGTPALSKPD